MNRASDLFLLLLNLSQMRNRNKIMELFLESLGVLFAPLTFEHAERERDGTVASFPIATRTSTYGHIVPTEAEPLSEENQTLLHNAIQMLAVVLERLDLEKKLETEKSSIELLAKERLQELLATVDQLRQSRSAYINLVEDLTQENAERQRAEAEVRRNRELLRMVLDIMPAHICAKNTEGRFVLVNKTLAEFYGTTVDEMTGVLHADICEDEEELKRMLAADREVIESGRPLVILEETMANPDGSTVFLETHKIPFSANNESAVLVVSMDITARKRMEETLRSSGIKQGKMLANIGDVIVIIDAAGINRYKSPNLEKWFGWRPEELVGESALGNVHPEDVDAAQKFIGTLLAAPDAVGTTECRYRCKDGGYKWIEFIGVNLLHDPDIRGLLGNYQDITERKRAQAEKAKLEAQFQQAQKMESVGRLAGGVAHDFNNMLQAILGNAALALEEIPPGSPVRESLEEIQKAALRSTDLTRQLLAFARRQTISPKVLDLNEAVEGLLKMLRRLIGEDIQLAWLPAADLGPVKVDPTQIDQILANLCVNARDAIGGVGKITIETGNAVFNEAYCADHPGFMPGEYVLLAVSDDGCGMDKETQAHLFEPFFTTKGVGEGTGLGLATIYGIVKQNAGFIHVYSEPDQGTTFKIHLPRHAGQPAVTQPECLAQLPQNSGETVLLVEDESSILAITRRVLERLGYTVLTASRPGEAIRLVGAYAGQIRLLLTDMVMPEMNGRELAKQLLSIHPELRCLFMSGYTADVIAHHGVLDEGVHFIQKPFSIEDLAAKVRQTLGG